MKVKDEQMKSPTNAMFSLKGLKDVALESSLIKNNPQTHNLS
ncbi:hypothetical protein VYF65_003887 [Lysinibacillus irui]